MEISTWISKPFLTAYRSRMYQNNNTQELLEQGHLHFLIFIHEVLKFSDKLYLESKLDESPEDLNLKSFFSSLGKAPICNTKRDSVSANYFFLNFGEDCKKLSEDNGAVYLDMRFTETHKDYFQTRARRIKSINIGKELAPFHSIEIMDPYFVSNTETKKQLEQELNSFLSKKAKRKDLTIIYNNYHRQSKKYYQKEEKQIEDTADILGIDKKNIFCKPKKDCDDHDRSLITNTCFYILGHYKKGNNVTHLTSYPIYKFNLYVNN